MSRQLRGFYLRERQNQNTAGPIRSSRWTAADESNSGKPETGVGKTMKASEEIVFLLDMDNTLFDNDRVEADLRNHLEREFEPESRDRYWAMFEVLRAELGYADNSDALQRYRLGDLNDSRPLLMSFFLMDYPFGVPAAKVQRSRS